MKDDGLRDLFRTNLPGVHWQSVEMFLLASGVPDANGCCQGREFWVEFKATEANAVEVRPGQVGWIERRLRSGGRVFVAVRRHCAAGRRRAARDELWLLAGAAIRSLADSGLNGVEDRYVLGSWSGGPAGWDWAEVAVRLTGGR